MELICAQGARWGSFEGVAAERRRNIRKKIKELANTPPAEIVELFNDGHKKLPKAIRLP